MADIKNTPPEPEPKEVKAEPIVPKPEPKPVPKPEPTPAPKPKPAPQPTKPASVSPSPEPTAQEIRAKLEGLFTDKTVLTEVVKIICAYKTKRSINNALMKKYENQKAGEIYKKIKPYIAYKKGS